MTSRKILIVDDDDNIRFVAGMSLELDWEVVEANCGQRALEQAEKEKPNVVLLDIMMPGMDGLETLSRLRTMRGLQDTPVIFMTAKVQTHEIGDYLKCGAAGLIAKPFDPMTLSEQISQIAAEFQNGRLSTTVCTLL
jgi:two-component system OmpR family response regulator